MSGRARRENRAKNALKVTGMARGEQQMAFRPGKYYNMNEDSKVANEPKNKPNPTPSEPSVKKDAPFNFLMLPPEIKNKIYDLVFEPRRVEITRQKGRQADQSEEDKERKGPPTRKLTYRPLFPRGKDHIVRPAMRRDGPKPMVNMLFLSKQIYTETLLYLYSTTQFVFKSSKALRRFLRHIPFPARRAIRHLELNNSTYGEPVWTKSRFVKVRSDMRWVQTCQEIRDTFMLRELHINFQICDWPLHLDLTEEWARSLLCFVGLELEYASISLASQAFAEIQLTLAADALEKLIMTDEGYEKKTLERHKTNTCEILNLRI